MYCADMASLYCTIKIGLRSGLHHMQCAKGSRQVSSIVLHQAWKTGKEKEKKKKGNIFHSYIAHAISIHRARSTPVPYSVLYVIGACSSLFLRLCIV